MSPKLTNHDDHIEFLLFFPCIDSFCWKAWRKFVSSTRRRLKRFFFSTNQNHLIRMRSGGLKVCRHVVRTLLLNCSSCDASNAETASNLQNLLSDDLNGVTSVLIVQTGRQNKICSQPSVSTQERVCAIFWGLSHITFGHSSVIRLWAPYRNTWREHQLYLHFFESLVHVRFRSYDWKYHLLFKMPFFQSVFGRHSFRKQYSAT